MSRMLKELIVKELRSKYEQCDSALVVNPIRLTGRQAAELRAEFDKKSIEMRLVRNSLAKRAFDGLPLAGVEKVLDGPCALVTGGESIVDTAKELAQWSKKLPQLEVVGAVVEGQVLDAASAEQLAKMPGRAELRSQVSGMIASPGAALAAAIASPGGAIAGCIKTLIERLEGEGGSQAA